MPNFGYHLARLKAALRRSLYGFLMPWIARRAMTSPRPIDLEIFSYSGENTLPEQVASIRSFLRFVGRPRRFTVVSDGSHSEKSMNLLKSIDSCVAVRLRQEPPSIDLPEKFRGYLANHPTGKQLALIMSLPEDGPCVYVDSDVLFFKKSCELKGLVAAKSAPAYYLLDCQFSGDRRLVREPAEEIEPVNTGFLFLFETLDWSIASRRFQELKGDANFFTNQTLTHLTMHANGARRLDPAKYVLQLDDQFVYADRYAGPNLALRHYVNPVRHKFWNSVSF